MDNDKFTNNDDNYYKSKHDSGRIIRAWVETTSEFTDTNSMSAPQAERTITLRAPTENNLRPEKITENTDEYAAHSNLHPTLLTNNTTRYSQKAEHPDFTIKRSNVSVTADSTRISPSFRRPQEERTNPRKSG